MSEAFFSTYVFYGRYWINAHHTKKSAFQPLQGLIYQGRGPIRPPPHAIHNNQGVGRERVNNIFVNTFCNYYKHLTSMIFDQSIFLPVTFHAPLLWNLHTLRNFMHCSLLAFYAFYFKIKLINIFRSTGILIYNQFNAT